MIDYIDFFAKTTIDLFWLDISLFSLNTILAIVIIFLERKNTSSSLAWIFVLVLLPGIGFLFYILLSQNIARRKIFKYTDDERDLYDQFLSQQAESFRNGTFKFNDTTMALYKDQIIFHNQLSESFYTQNNDIHIFTDGNDKFNQLLEDIDNAKHHIHILYFIINNDDLGNRLLVRLKQKAESGIEVRLLIDYFGSRNITKKMVRDLEASGVHVCHFFPSKFKLFNLKANYRNHRKIVVVDGEVGYIGGFNVGDEYLGLKKKFGYWRDTHLRIKGDAVVSLQIRFFLDWRLASKEFVEMDSEYFTISDNTKGSGVQIVSCGPDQIHEQIKQGFIKMIHSAKESICIQTPYFIPDESILEALRIAASSGVKIRIMVPNKPDHPFVYWATLSYIGDLLPYGIKAYTYEKGFMHAKTITVDGLLGSVGTCNFDIRSFKLNFEVNAFIYDQVFNTHLENLFYKDVKDCKEFTLDMYNNRNVYERFRERVSRIFTPIL